MGLKCKISKFLFRFVTFIISTIIEVNEKLDYRLYGVFAK